MVIGENILVTVMGVSGHTVRLGIEAPEGVSIYREEIWLAVEEENRAAAAAKVDELPASPPRSAAGADPGARAPARDAAGKRGAGEQAPQEAAAAEDASEGS